MGSRGKHPQKRRQANRRRAAVPSTKMAAKATVSRSLREGAAAAFEWCRASQRAQSPWDLIWDVITVLCSFADICCDLGVAWMFYRRGYSTLFSAACAIFFAAQVSYAAVYIGVCGTPEWSHKKRVAMFMCILPFAQLVPTLLWLQTFDIPLLNRLLKGLEFHAIPEAATREQDDRLLAYIRGKFRSHLGFMIEALVEAIPQCLLQTAAICMYPELANGVSIYSILMSITVVASKAYVVSYSPLLASFLLNVACIIADLVGIFASTTWVFTAHGVQGSFLIFCLMQASQYAVILLALGAAFVMVQAPLDDLKKNRSIDKMEHVYFAVSMVLVVLPVCVTLSIVKFGLIPLTMALLRSKRHIEADHFEQTLLELLPACLSQKERLRRIRVMNIFALFTEVHALAPNADLDSTLGMQRSLHSIRMRVGSLRYDWNASLLNLKMADDEALRTKQASTLQLIKSLSSRQVDLQAVSAGTEASLTQRGLAVCGARVRHLWGAVKSPRVLLSTAVCKVEQLRTDRLARIQAAMSCMWFLLFVGGLRYAPPFMFYMLLYFGQGMIFPVTELMHHLIAEGGGSETVKLPVLLSCMYCLCLVCILALLCRVAWHRWRLGVFVWRRRRMALPESFMHPRVVSAIVATLEDDDRQVERILLLRRKGLPDALASHVNAFVGPCLPVSEA